jgi:hypothetical protein
MATSTSLFLLAVGAILAIAVDYRVEGLDINAIGGILMVVGGIGLLFSILFLASYAPFRVNRPPYDAYDDPREPPHTHYP